MIEPDSFKPFFNIDSILLNFVPCHAGIHFLLTSFRLYLFGKFFNLQVIFNSFYPENSLSIAKDKSKEEREKKGIKDNSFVYGEIV